MRQSIYAKGFKHSNPVPAASRIGNIVMSGVISAKDAATGFIPDTLDEQVPAMFANFREILAASGAQLGHVIKMNVWLADFYDRKALNEAWVATFPDPDSRPARQAHALVGKEGKSVIICDFIAVIED